MNSSVINIKTNPETKKQAQAIAEELGFSLSSVINAFLKQLIRTRSVSFNIQEEPTEYLLNALEESRRDIEAGRVSPTFDSAEDAIAWLDDPNKKYQNQLQQEVHKAIR